jgi:hypothetical protein
MGTACRVIIEHLPVWEPGDPRQEWFCVVNASAIVDWHDVVFARLTGVRDETMEAWQAKPIVPIRGMPKNASEDSRREIGIAAIVTWATPAEIDRVFKPIELTEARWGWRFVRDTVRLLASHYGEDRVRLVIGVQTEQRPGESAITAAE